jgi:hypothetical protein
MDTRQLIADYPCLFHMAEIEAWPAILERGLLSTTALLDLLEIKGTKRAAIESQHRPESIIIDQPNHGSVVIRDQKPLRPAVLERVLDGMTAEEWYRLLNRKVFFWLTEARVRGLLRARAYRARSHAVVVVDTAQLVARHEEDITLAPINAGATLYNAPRRGPATFLRILDYPYEERRRARPSAPIVELAVDYAVPYLAECILRVERWRQDKQEATLWRA